MMTGTETKPTSKRVLDLAAALAKAKTVVEAIPVEDMKGACNRDTVEVVLKGWRRADVEAAATIAVLQFSKWRGGYWHFYGWDFWRGENRTMKAEAFVESMNRQGYPSRPFYMLD